jgi:hypothetical protein
MASLFDGLAELAQHLSTDPAIQRYIMYRQGFSPDIVEPQMERLAYNNRMRQMEEQARRQQATIAEQITQKIASGELTPQDILQIGAQDMEMGKFAADLWKTVQEQNNRRAFEGKGALIEGMNLAYQDFVSEGYDDFAAKKKAYDLVNTNQVVRGTDPLTGLPYEITRKSIFGNSIPERQDYVLPSLPPMSWKTQSDNLPNDDKALADSLGIPVEDLYWQPENEPQPITDDMIRRQQPESELGDALLRASGVKEAAQLGARAITAPIDQLIGTNFTNKIGGEGLAEASVLIDGYNERVKRSISSTKAFKELEQLDKKFSIDSLSQEGAKERLRGTLAILKREKKAMDGQLQNTQNVVQRQQIMSSPKYNELSQLIEEGENALRFIDNKKQNMLESDILFEHPTFGAITNDDIETTMRENNMTREQVLQALGAR